MGQIAAQESVIEGLRQERKLWGHELAQQGLKKKKEKNSSLLHSCFRCESGSRSRQDGVGVNEPSSRSDPS